MLTLLSPGGSDVFESQNASELLLIGSTQGVLMFRRQNDRPAWEFAGQSLADHHVHALLFEPSSQLLFAGVHKGTIYISKDLGKHWERRDQGITQPDVYCLNYAGQNGKIRVFAGTEPAHIFVTEDFGDRWTELPSLMDVPSSSKWTFHGPPHIGHVKHIAFDPASPGVIYVSIEIGGLLRSCDWGRTWEELAGVPEDVHRVIVLGSRPGNVYVCTGNGVFHSTDRCKTYQAVTTPDSRIGCPDGLIYHPRNDNILFISGASALPRTWRQTGSADARIGRSSDGGRTWKYFESGLPEHIMGNIEALSLHASDNTTYLFAGTTEGEVFFSDDIGESWSKLVSGIPPISKGRHYINLRKFRAELGKD